MLLLRLTHFRILWQSENISYLKKGPTGLHNSIFPHNPVYTAILAKNVGLIGTRLNWINPLIHYVNNKKMLFQPINLQASNQAPRFQDLRFTAIFFN